MKARKRRYNRKKSNIMKELKLNYSKWLPFEGFYAITLFGTVTRREKYRGTKLDKITQNHEGIHVCQSEDFIQVKKSNKFIEIINYVIFYLLYVLEWLFKAIASLFTGFKIKAYKSISFEQEAYSNQYNLLYQNNRKRFAWVKYIFKFVK